MISAVIAPVAFIEINSHDIIQRIESNTMQYVTPVVTVDSFRSKQVAITSGVAKQYQAILASYQGKGQSTFVYKAAPQVSQQTRRSSLLYVSLTETTTFVLSRYL